MIDGRSEDPQQARYAVEPRLGQPVRKTAIGALQYGWVNPYGQATLLRQAEVAAAK